MMQLLSPIRRWLVLAANRAVTWSTLLLVQMAVIATPASARQDQSGNSETFVPEPIPFKESDFDLGSALTEIVLLLVGLFVIAAVVMLLVRKRLIASGIIPERSGGHIQILDKKVISSRTTTVLLEVDGKKVLVCEGTSGVAISPLSDASEGERKEEQGEKP